MLSKNLESKILQSLEDKKREGTYKTERVLIGPQGTEIYIEGKEEPLLNFCANNYLGLSNHPKIRQAAKSGVDQNGFGLSSVRFICGTMNIHKQLENEISQFLETEDTILFSSCFDANGGLFENFLTSEDVIISASLNHASIIDGVRLTRCKKLIYQYNDMNDLEQQLQNSSDNQIKIVITDGVFSMEGNLAPLDKISYLCDKYSALLVIDDCHATGFIGDKGKGTAEYHDVHDKVDLFTGTLGKALGGASGGYISGEKILIDWLRNTSRPYLFSNSIAPNLIAGALKSLEIIQSMEGEKLRNLLKENTLFFRQRMTSEGFNITEGVHPIIPIMIGDAVTASKMADDLLNEGIYVIAFSYPVVPKGTARIRVQISAIHSKEQLERAIKGFIKLRKKYGVIS